MPTINELKEHNTKNPPDDERIARPKSDSEYDADSESSELPKNPDNEVASLQGRGDDDRWSLATCPSSSPTHDYDPPSSGMPGQGSMTPKHPNYYPRDIIVPKVHLPFK